MREFTICYECADGTHKEVSTKGTYSSILTSIKRAVMLHKEYLRGYITRVDGCIVKMEGGE